MKKSVAVLTVVVIGFAFSSCKKTCTCELIKVKIEDGNKEIISSSDRGNHKIDKSETCENLATDKNGSSAGISLLAWMFVSGVRGEAVSVPDDGTYSYYECTEK
jgi:hypothetical protein